MFVTKHQLKDADLTSSKEQKSYAIVMVPWLLKSLLTIFQVFFFLNVWCSRLRVVS